MIHPILQYASAVEFLFSLQWFGTKLGLENTKRLASLVGDPHHGLKFIHVAGTNGKGSTCAILESIYRAQGYRVGLFTSPHLISFCERIQVDRELIPPSKVVALVDRLKPVLASFPPDQHPTFFEVVTVMALLYFAEQQCDIVIWETGMGGRLDATNIVQPLATLITNVQLDHQKWLGNTIPEIAFEKAGIMKSGVPAFTAAEGEALQSIRVEATRLHVALECTDSEIAALALAPYRGSLSLYGAHQVLNAGLAVLTARSLGLSLQVTEESIRQGLATVSWPGRFQVFQRGPQTIILDGAHNPAGITALVDAFQTKYPGTRPVLIMGVLKDKDYAEMVQILSRITDRVICCSVNSLRSAAPDELIAAFQKANPSASTVFTSAPSFPGALSTTAQAPLVLVTGSLFFIGEALEYLLGTDATPSSNERGLNEWNAAKSPLR
jgi:dihydrofolate synthase/folylpolyglutamate synthase